MKRIEDKDPRRPVGRVIGRFRSQKLAWTDPESGQSLEIDAFGPEAILRELQPLGFDTLPSDDDPPGGGERALGAGRMVLSDEPSVLARGASVPPRATFRARISPEEFLSGPS